MFQKHVAQPGASGPLKDITLRGLPENASEEEKWETFKKRCLLDEKGGAYVAAEVMKEGLQQLAPHMENSTPEEKAALLVTYFKQGGRTMKKNYDARTAREGKTDMRPGEGAAMFHNMDTIRKILE